MENIKKSVKAVSTVKNVKMSVIQYSSFVT